MALDLVARVTALRAECVGHKYAIRKNRQELARKTEQLLELEASCRRLGIPLVIHEGVEGELHGRQNTRT